jgi:hypothetical protein
MKQRTKRLLSTIGSKVSNYKNEDVNNMTTIYSISLDGQERMDTVHPDNIAKQIKILQNKGQIKIKVIK